MSKKKYAVTALGCRTNQYEAQAFRTQLEAMGYEAAAPGEEADICIVNTCTVTEGADGDSRHKVRRFARQHPNAKLLVTGCLAERQPSQMEEIDGVDWVIPNSEKELALAKLFPEEDLPEFNIKQFEGHTRAFLKVQDGCNSFCTYCIIPYVRGRSRSRGLAEVVKEAEELVASGFKEIVLTGINIGDFDGGVSKGEPKVSLADLVRAVDGVPGLERLRISSIDPDEVDEDLLQAVIDGQHTCKSMHIVLQAGSNVVLKRMNRKYTRQLFMETIERLRAAHPDFTFTTDIIVGFPGETEYDFAETLEVMKEVRFAKVHMFPYSDRPRTRANLYPNKVAPEEIRRRKQEVLRLAEKQAYDLREPFVGRRMWVLTESTDSTRPGEISGHTDNFLRVWVQAEGIEANDLVEVELIENTPDGLLGRPVCEQGQKVG